MVASLLDYSPAVSPFGHRVFCSFGHAGRLDSSHLQFFGLQSLRDQLFCHSVSSAVLSGNFLSGCIFCNLQDRRGLHPIQYARRRPHRSPTTTAPGGHSPRRPPASCFQSVLWRRQQASSRCPPPGEDVDGRVPSWPWGCVVPRARTTWSARLSLGENAMFRVSLTKSVRLQASGISGNELRI